MFLISSSRSLRSTPRLTRALHHSLSVPPVPQSTTAVPDVATFLTRIGRKTAMHAPKFEQWEHLFSTTSAQLKALGVEPARMRKYILRWRETFRVHAGRVALVEHARGRKVDGGERRRKEVRAKRFAEERKALEGAER